MALEYISDALVPKLTTFSLLFNVAVMVAISAFTTWTTSEKTRSIRAKVFSSAGPDGTRGAEDESSESQTVCENTAKPSAGMPLDISAFKAPEMYWAKFWTRASNSSFRYRGCGNKTTWISNTSESGDPVFSLDHMESTSILRRAWISSSCFSSICSASRITNVNSVLAALPSFMALAVSANTASKSAYDVESDDRPISWYHMFNKRASDKDAAKAAHRAWNSLPALPRSLASAPSTSSRTTDLFLASLHAITPLVVACVNDFLSTGRTWNLVPNMAFSRDDLPDPCGPRIPTIWCASAPSSSSSGNHR
mmetsp:Transcript_14464/g.24929  ORF Transcript_14464/g.24929 Transcript_14464/m.24929 type:complete len:309 (-) Transcript_14464:209-1135(-)